MERNEAEVLEKTSVFVVVVVVVVGSGETWWATVQRGGGCPQVRCSSVDDGPEDAAEGERVAVRRREDAELFAVGRELGGRTDGVVGRMERLADVEHVTGQVLRRHVLDQVLGFGPAPASRRPRRCLGRQRHGQQQHQLSTTRLRLVSIRPYRRARPGWARAVSRNPVKLGKPLPAGWSRRYPKIYGYMAGWPKTVLKTTFSPAKGQDKWKNRKNPEMPR